MKTLRKVTFKVKVNPASHVGLGDVADFLKTLKGAKAGVEDVRILAGGRVEVTMDAEGYKPKKFAKAVSKYTYGNLTLVPES
jgi:hypothetical protein